MRHSVFLKNPFWTDAAVRISKKRGGMASYHSVYFKCRIGVSAMSNIKKIFAKSFTWFRLVSFFIESSFLKNKHKKSRWIFLLPSAGMCAFCCVRV